ncbi:MAG: hypothetical protein V4590_08085 [Bacteroidota bacterium]
MNRILFILFFVFTSGAFGQQLVDKQIEVGMLVKLTACKSGSKAFTSMDMYRKTRIPEGKIIIDTLTGDGVFENFFAPGDFDARRLPCDYANKKYKVAALREFDDDKTKSVKRVMILYTSDPYTMIWVEFDKAVELKEIVF